MSEQRKPLSRAEELLADHLREEEQRARQSEPVQNDSAPAPPGIVIQSMAAAPASAVPQAAEDAKDVGAVVATISKLADGNRATASDVRLVGGVAATRPVRLGMTVKIGWSSTKETRYGRAAVQGSLQCDCLDSVNRHLGKACGAACRDLAVSAGVAERMRKAPVAAYADWKDGHKIADLPDPAHHYEKCGPCRGSGSMNCTCGNGQIACNTCGRTGTARCNNCGGVGTTRDHRGDAVRCGGCYGSGRHGNCYTCAGSGWVNCNHCGGRAKIQHKACGGHGSFTHLYRAHLEGKIARTLAFEEGVPEGFRASCLALSTLSMADGNGILRRVEATSGPAEAVAYLHCEVRHVHASMLVKDIDVTVDAVGPRLAIPLMPTFIDDLLDFGGLGHLTVVSEKAARSNPAARLAEATQARVTTDILGLVGGGSAVDAEAVSTKWKGAISTGFVTKLEVRLRRAYAHAGRSSVRRAWLLAAVPVAALMALANAYHLPLRAFLAVWPGSAGYTGAAVVGFLIAQAAVAIPILAVAWFVAGHRARASLRAGVGSLAKARPRQGVWPWAGLAVAVAAGWIATVMRVEAASIGLPYAPVVLSAAGQQAAQARPAQQQGIVPYATKVATDISCPATLDGHKLSSWKIVNNGVDPERTLTGKWSWNREKTWVWIRCGYHDTAKTMELPVDKMATQCINRNDTPTFQCM